MRGHYQKPTLPSKFGSIIIGSGLKRKKRKKKTRSGKPRGRASRQKPKMVDGDDRTDIGPESAPDCDICEYSATCAQFDSGCPYEADENDDGDGSDPGADDE